MSRCCLFGSDAAASNLSVPDHRPEGHDLSFSTFISVASTDAPVHKLAGETQ